MTSPLLQQALLCLEWHRFLELSLTHACTAPARAALTALSNEASWAQSLGAARLRQSEIQEITPLLDKAALWEPLRSLEDPAATLERLSRGGVLEVAELALLRKWLEALDAWAQIPREELRGELFKKAVSQLPDPLEQLKLLTRILTPEGELSERASPRLQAIHGEIRLLKKEIAQHLDFVLKSYAQKGILQEQFSDVRDGRFVIPVKISAQHEIDGVVHDASVSRQTVFIEPREVALLNNRLRHKQNELIQEIHLILTDASQRLRPFHGEMEGAFAVLGHWDLAQARARFGREYSGKPITVSESTEDEAPLFVLTHTAHPLLWWSIPREQIVRNTLEFGGDSRTLLITGPNTGGKTVFLKTVGLAALCARAGFPFPAMETPVVPFFERIFADVGDPQSLQQHLSSFSGHIIRYKQIIETLGEPLGETEKPGLSLVLIDELNSATDPEEGAALGRAVLETLMEQQAFIITTTHDPHLKAMALTDERILSASVSFDESSRSPTYRLIPGSPGRSRAIETAERLGLPQTVLEKARAHLSKGHQDFEALLQRLESNTAETERAKREAVELRAEAERLEKEWRERTEKSLGEVMERTRARLRNILEQAQDAVRAQVRKLDEAKSRKSLDESRQQINESTHVAQERIESALREEAPEVAEALNKAKADQDLQSSQNQNKQSFTPGSAVRIPKFKTTGTLLEIKGSKVKVAMGSIQMNMSLSDLEPLSREELAQHQRLQERKKGYKIQDSDDSGDLAISERIDLRGKRLDEAMSELEAYLDRAFRSGRFAEVTIVHGLGTGAIRENARNILARLPYVKTYTDGGSGRGGTGATIVEFDR